MKKNGTYYTITAAAGILILLLGGFFLKTVTDPQGIMKTLPYICIGIGCGTFGCGMGNVISRNVMKKHPDIQKQSDIDRNDERYIAIANRSKAKAFDITIFVFGALMLSYALMSFDLTAILLLVFAYLFIIASWIYYLNKYNKEM